MHISSRVSTAGLVALVALNVVAVGWALRSNDTTAASPPPTSVGSPSASVRPSSTSSAKPSPPATGTATTAPAAPLQTILVAINDKAAWRINVGTCAKGGAKVATTTDGGTTWADAKAPLGTIVRVRPTDGQAAFVVGAGSTCVAELKDTSDGGATWTSGSAVGSAWFRDPNVYLIERTRKCKSCRSNPDICSALSVILRQVVDKCSSKTIHVIAQSLSY